MPAAGLAGFAQVERDLAIAVHAAAGQPVVLGQAQQTLVFTIAWAGRRAQPGVVPAAVHTQHPTHRAEAKLPGMHAHERVLRLHPQASTRRLFRISRSPTCFTASHLNSSVCCQLLRRNTSIIAISYGK